ncbi:hypothetical protein V8E55_005964 [Tylopilus felleus]
MLTAFLSLVSLALYVTFAAAVPYVRRDVNVDVAGLLGAHADGAVTILSVLNWSTCQTPWGMYYSDVLTYFSRLLSTFVQILMWNGKSASGGTADGILSYTSREIR